jgi:glycosyltransferase involved in cell wall biosynthesis
MFFIPDVISLTRRLKNDAIDLAHCNGSWQIKAPLAAWLAGIRVLWHLNDTRMPAFVKCVFNMLSSMIADFLILASQRVQTYYMNNNLLKKIPSLIIQAPVDTQRLDPDKVGSPPKTGEADTCHDVVFISNITPVKGVEYFIEMAGLLSAKRNDVAFHLFGRCYKNQQKYVDRLVAFANQQGVRNLHWHGFRNDVMNVLNSADVFVCTSLYEASPTVVWEAMSMAKAIVSTDVGDVRIIIENGKSGFVVPTRNPAALAQKIEILLSDPELRRSFGREARNRAKALLDVATCAGLHEEAYRRTLSL